MITSNRKSGFNKKDLTEQLAAKAGIPKSTAAKTINLLHHHFRCPRRRKKSHHL